MQRNLSGLRLSQQGILRLESPAWTTFSHWLPSFRSEYHTSAPCDTLQAFRPTQARTLQDDIFIPRRRRGEAAYYDEDLTFSEALRQGISKAITGLQEHATDEHAPYTQKPSTKSAMYGKWHSLSLDEERLLVETDFENSEDETVQLVDQPGNENDIELWTCLLDFCHRRMANEGVVKIWQAVAQRRTLFRIEGPLADFFWMTILNVALSNRSMLSEVFDYAEWLHTVHRIEWPRLYTTVIGYMLDKDQRDDLMPCHLRMMQVARPSEAELVSFLEQSVVMPVRRQISLQRLYSKHPYRNLYDIILPRLYFMGYVTRALHWRRVLLKYNDGPRSPAARPFLRYVISYCRGEQLTDEEIKVAESNWNWRGGESRVVQSTAPTANGENFRYMVNRIHGEAFGMREKQYNDSLGAKWFASSWVSVDFAINVVYTMGMQEIGPLSLQSIALRENSAQGVLDRMEQLDQLRIRLPDTVYVKAIRHYAVVGDNEALQDLLHTDVHPDVFDDNEALTKILEDSIRVENWKIYRLVVQTVLAVMSQQRTEISNSVLASCLRGRKDALAIQVLREMASYNIDLSSTTSDLISSFLLHTLSPHAKATDQSHPRLANATRRRLDLQTALIQQLAATRFPPAVQVWQTIIYRLGREQRLNELERLSFYIIDLFTKYATADQPIWFAHSVDVPKSFREDGPYPHFQKLPRDLPSTYAAHPLRQIFDDKLQGAIVRWGFQYTRYTPAQEDEAAGVLYSAANKAAVEAGKRPLMPRFDWLNQEDPKDPPERYHFARGIRLLAMLRDQGLAVQASKVSKQARLRLCELYRRQGRKNYQWPGGTKAGKQRRRLNRLSLVEAMALCQEAWGEQQPIVPSLAEMEEYILRMDLEDQKARRIKRVDRLRETSRGELRMN